MHEGVKAMESGQEAAQRVQEYMMKLEDSHVSFYEKYCRGNSYDRMVEGKEPVRDPPPD